MRTTLHFLTGLKFEVSQICPDGRSVVVISLKAKSSEENVEHSFFFEGTLQEAEEKFPMIKGATRT